MYITNITPPAAGAQKLKRRRSYGDPTQPTFSEEIEVALSPEALGRAGDDTEGKQQGRREQQQEQPQGEQKKSALDITA